MKYIDVKGAKEHNLKNINVKIPRDKLVVLTGLSGSGKSSLAFDTIRVPFCLREAVFRPDTEAQCGEH